jgi:hypothetical protein
MSVQFLVLMFIMICMVMGFVIGLSRLHKEANKPVKRLIYSEDQINEGGNL